MPTTGEATRLELDGVSRRYTTTVAGRTVRLEALPATTLHVRRGEWVAVTGAGPGPLTLLRCAAGLVPPEAGRVRWLDDSGREVGSPRIALVHADQAPYGCWTVRDALWGTVAPRCSFARAERRIELALRCSALDAVAGRLVADLGVPDRWRVNVAAAVAGGAGWLFLEFPPFAWEVDARPSASLASLRHMRRALAALGIGAVVGGAGTVPFALHRRVALAQLAVTGESSADPASGALARVAEPGERDWERAGTGVASPSWPL